MLNRFAAFEYVSGLLGAATDEGEWSSIHSMARALLTIPKSNSSYSFFCHIRSRPFSRDYLMTSLN
jgi:hypothetical protein